MINNMQSSLTKRFQAIWEDLCSARSMYENKCKRRIQRQLEIAGYNMGDDEIETALASGVSVFSKEFGECEAAKLALRDLEDRHEELLALEKNIQEMHDLFVELNLLVECQGEMIDSIEINVTQAVLKVDDGKICLQEAKKKQSSFRKKKIICIAVASGAVILAVAIAIIIIFNQYLKLLGSFVPYDKQTLRRHSKAKKINCTSSQLKSRSVFKTKNVGNLCSFSVMFLNAHGMNQQVTGEGDTQPPNARSSSAATARRNLRLQHACLIANSTANGGLSPVLIFTNQISIA
uniref:t-SNARE coiled-coil homology domain-containing protein n=1 Tax=Daphnia galeata TaxID=27404 RepID=A0A8J2WEG4_9CRUS|nr:unnamed protein product [Daphnia galeata]